MKILYIITQADGGGAQKYVLDLAQHFDGAIAAGTEASQLFDEAHQRGIKTFSLHHLKRNPSLWHDFAALFEIKKLIEQEQPDIVHLNSSKAGFLGSIAGKLAGATVVFTAHGFFYFKRAAWHIRAAYTILEWFASRFRNLIITVSEEDRQQALAHHLLPADKVVTIYNGIPPIDFRAREDARAELRLPEGKFVLGNVAQLYNRKAIDIFISAVALLDDKIKSKIVAVVLGEGPDRAIFEKLIKQLGLQRVFLLPGFRPQAVTFLKAFDAFILSSRREGFPYVLLEALQAGLPIAATNVGGNKEALGDAGLIVEPNNPEKLAVAIQQLMNDNDLRARLSQKSAERAKQFTLENMIGQTKQIYNQLLDKKQP